MNLLAVIVIYNCDICESKTVNSLLSIKKNVFDRFKIIIYDNSCKEQDIAINFPFQYQYTHSRINGGVVKAYNFAFGIAIKEKFDWLMLLDQDSELNEDYFIKINETLIKINNEDNVVSCVPKIFHGDTFFSPSKVLWGEVHRPIDVSHVGISDREIMAIGSGTVVRTSFLEEINGFNELFWLDYLDQWLFHTIFSNGKKVYVIDSYIKHELSIFNFNKLMNLQRYKNQLKYETLYMKSYTSKLENLFFLIRLTRRSIILLFRTKNSQYFKMTFKQITNIVLGRV